MAINYSKSKFKNTKFDGTEGIVIPSGDASSRPTGEVGHTRFNTDSGSLEFYDGTNWVATNLTPRIDSLSGEIYQGTATTLTIEVTNGTDLINVIFSEGGIEVASLTDVTNSNGTVTASVPASVYNQSAGDVITISISNVDGTPSSNSIDKTVLALPTGGSISTSGNYRIHTFTSSGTFTIPSGLGNLSIEYLVIGGGGAGSKAHATNTCGGGGAGGYRTSVPGQTSGRNSSAETPLSLGAGSYTVTIGAGGTCNTAAGNFDGTPGSSTTFSSITSLGGGKGGGSGNDTNQAGGPGGSGGGGASYDTSTNNSLGGAGTAGQGFDGGDFTGGTQGGAGGGGGAGAEGATQGTNLNGGNGGNGLSSNITGGTITRAGGGGGTGWNEATPGSGGAGGGGSASVTSNTAQSGAANTGSGGGAAKSAGVAGNGGSGLVVVRYQL